MGKAKELYNTTKTVKEILMQDERARNSDSFLYFKVLVVIGNINGIDISKMSVPTFLLHMSEMGFPPFESVRRTRQKIQQHHPELAGCKAVEEQRILNEEIFREYAKKVNI